MRIVFQDAVIADGGRGSPVGLSVGGRKDVASASYLRGGYGRVFDRGNALVELAWEHARRFESAAEAQHFALAHGDSIPSGEATAFLILSGGTALQLTEAVLDVPELAGYGGVRTTHRYRLTARTVTGGALPAWSSGGAGIVFDGALLSGGGIRGFASFSAGGEKALDVAGALRAATARPVDRKNRLHTLAWVQSRDFASADEAEQFLLLHGQAVPAGTHDLTATLDNGTVVTLADAVMQVPQGRRIAATRTLHTYRATGRAISADAVAPGWLDPNGPGLVSPFAVTHEGLTVTHEGETVTHTT